jgi:hypothetical protein
MIRFLGLGLIVSIAASTAHSAPRGHKSTITFGKSEKVQVTAAKKRNFKQDIEAVNKAHQNWKKAHLNKVLYLCQKNGEETASLARKVADKMEASKTETTREAEQLVKGLASALNEADDPKAALLTDQQRSQLRAKLDAVESARKKSLILERLALQVKTYYLTDAPKASPFTGSCRASYGVALQKSLETSTRYYEDSRALTVKIDGLAERARTALHSLGHTELVAGR